MLSLLLQAQAGSAGEALVAFFQRSPIPAAGAGAALWMIIALPLLGAFVCGVFGKVLGRANVHLIALGAVFGSFLLSVLVFWAIADANTSAESAYAFGAVPYAVGGDFGTWFAAGDFKVTFGLFVDHLSGTMLLVITGVGFLIHLYSTGYMAHDAAYWRYFAYLNLFVAMMLTLVLADSLVLLFVGWEGVGLCSYLLIGFWYEDPAKAFAGRKAFVVNRIGDFGFLSACFLLVVWSQALLAQARPESFSPRQAGGGQFSSAQVRERLVAGVRAQGPLGFQGLEELAKAVPAETDTVIEKGPLAGHTFGAVLTAILLLFLLGAAGKSAQLPLYVWLPDAMAGPTPVSALIHAATMVTAGLYLFCRLSYLLVLSPTAMATIALVGGATALLAALIAFAQDELKKVLAYSTVSQLGIMFLGIGAGAFWAAFLHVVTHAFFKACLFLGAGSVMHGNGDEANIKKLGGLRALMPLTWITFLISTLAITGILPLSGFFSKDAILHALHHTELKGHEHVLHVAWVLGLLTALCTAFYMTRLYLLTFEGTRAVDAKVPAAKVHESEPVMTGPLVVLATLAALAALHGIPFMPNARGEDWKQPVMENFLSPVFNTADALARRTGNVISSDTHEVPWGAWGQAWAIALLGGGAAFFLYRRFFPARAGQPAPAGLALVRRFAQQRFYVDEVYDFLVIRPLKGLSVLLYRVVDALLIDTVAVRGTAWLTATSGSLLRYLQSGDAQGYAAVMALALAGGLLWALWGSF